MAKSARISIFIARPTWYDVRPSGRRSSTKVTAKPKKNQARVLIRVGSFAPKQTGGTNREDRRHGCEDGEHGELGEESLAEIVEQADEQAADKRSLETAQPADDHDNERK